MSRALPYRPDLCHLLRRLATPGFRAVWLRLDAGRREVFGAFPVAGVVLADQQLGNRSASGFLYKEAWPEFWSELPALLASLPAGGRVAGAFQGGLMGFMGYGPAPAGTRAGFPTAWMGLYPRFITVDHERQSAEFISLPGYEAADERWEQAIENVTAATKGGAPLDATHLPAFRLTRPFAPLTPPARYRECFARIQAYLHAGDCYQVNYAQAFQAGCEGSGALAMERLLQTSQPGHAAWISLPEGEVLSLSPELFLRVRDRHIVTRPIKGTAPRHNDTGQDDALRRGLAQSPKDRAENLMIVDLLRHDIGQHALTGSVRVDSLFEVETLPQVHHLVSTVSGRLREDAHVVDLIRDSFPGGSITGAPKKRAMQIIAELEDTPRSVYCGSIGFLGVDGAVELNIAIRTLLRIDGEIFAWAGGGIVADSECEAEYAECFHKIGALMRALEEM